jgi:hypothetical protein
MSVVQVVRTAVVAAAAAALFVPASEAAQMKGRGTIQAVDWNVMQMAIKGIDNKVNTFRVAGDCGIKYTDGAEVYSKLRDLAPRMYIYFIYEDYNGQEAPMLQNVEVREVPKDMLQARANQGGNAAPPSTGESSRQIKVTILKITDEKKGDFRADVAGNSQTFRAQNARDLRAFREGDVVVLTLERRLGREVVTRFERSKRD